MEQIVDQQIILIIHICMIYQAVIIMNILNSKLFTPFLFSIRNKMYFLRHYNNRYNYSNENYQKKRPANKNSKRISTSAINNRQPTNGSNNNNRHHSTSDNDQKEGEEWETASESSTNMRNDHYDTNAINSEQTNETKPSNHRGRTPPKKSFSSQR